MLDFVAHPLVEPSWLAAHLADGDVRVVDARWRGDGTDRELYRQGHLPGAVHLDWQRDLSWTDERGVGYLLLPPAPFAAIMEASGIGDRTRVVAYAETDHSGAAQLWWALRYYGHEQVAVLNGGVSFVQGDIQALPFEDERFDFLWSRDMLMHVPALPAALAECARVLKPAGAMLVYTTVATGRMEPKEAAWLYASFGLVPESMDEQAVEAAFRAAGFQMGSKEQLGSELMEWVEEHEGRASRELMRLARMLRKPEYYQELLGARRYEVALANYHWALYILLEKLSPTLYILRKSASS